MKPHLPVRLFKSVLACLAVVSFSVGSGAAGAADSAAFILGAEESLTIDYADASTLPVVDGVVQLLGGTQLHLSSCGEGDGKTYTLLTGVSGLLDAAGNELSLDASNNAISSYFDTTQPGTGFWAADTLQLNDGQLQLVRHSLPVRDALTVSQRQTGSQKYSYYAGVAFEDITTSGSSYGSAIDGGDDSTITLSDNGSVTFSGNTASSSYDDAYGGAIYGGMDSTITLSGNGSVTFSSNRASSSSFPSLASGGAIGGSTITLSGNGSVTFSGNTASSTSYSASGGAIYGVSSSIITLNDNGSVSFSGNTASGEYAGGGAIYGSTITLSDNGSVTFSSNRASSSSYDAYGGAIYGRGNSTITLSGNGSVTFSGNTATSSRFAYGGAIYGGDGSTITLNDNGSVTFSGNTASSSYDDAYGGTIYGGDGSTITLSDNGSVTFSGNTASGEYAYGGAICTYGNLSIRNNDAVLFEKNAEIRNGSYRLRSIHAWGGSGDVISLSAAEGKSIEFRDSIYIGSGSTVEFNADYTDSAGEVHAQKGDIIFTGAYTEAHLNELLADAGAGRVATAEEIRLSRTSEVLAMTNLYGGRLRVEAGAIYRGYGITAMEGSNATVRLKDATLNHSGSDLTFHSGTTLELLGKYTLYGDVKMQEGSHFAVSVEQNDTSYIFGSLQLGGDVSLSLSDSLSGENTILLYVSGGVTGWNEENITLESATIGMESLSWVDNMLVLNHNAATFNHYFNGGYSASGRLTGDVWLCHYEDVTFENLSITSTSSSSSGGAIDGVSYSNITLSGNGSVTFSGNTASSSDVDAYGGAIYGKNNSTITLSGNESVTFSGNTASSSDVDAHSYGGAIRGGDDSTITLSGNGSVTFSGNTASGEYAYGGAIYGDSNSTITLSDNGSATFSSNTASYGGAIYGSTITLSGNESVTFSGNTASSTSYSANGGAIRGRDDSTITLSGNGSVTFSENTASSASASAYGGAIYGGDYSNITLSDNGSVTFSGNTASSASASSYGGAIRTYGNLSIRNNDAVLFEKNAEIVNDSYRLRSIYAGGSGDVISLSAAEGKSIEFRDSIYIGFGSTVEFNADYTDSAGVVHVQKGDIIFTGAYTEAHLNELLEDAGAGRVATAEEIRLSRTTEVLAMTNLYGGRLRVEAGAIYRGYGITAMEGSNATVRLKDATLNHSGSDLTFHSGTTLELLGKYTLYGDVKMQEGSHFAVSVEQNDTSYIFGSLQLGGDVSLSLSDSLSGENTILLYVSGGVTGWNEENITLESATIRMESLSWVDNMLVLNHNAATFNHYFNGGYSASGRLTGDVWLCHYEDVTFENLSITSTSSSSYGGAIYGEDYSVITLSGNGSVTFSGNTASSSYDDAYAYGGAIYGGRYSTITLSGNGSVTFSGNTTSSSHNDAYAYGGAIYGGRYSTITLSGNGSVTFSGNTASSSYDDGYGGAIYGGRYSTITLSGNGSVTFSGNSAYSGGAIYGESSSIITLNDNGSVSFSGNTARYSGGAIFGESSITLNDNGRVSFSENTASSYGGAIYGESSSIITLNDNCSVSFSGNTARYSGGAIFGESTITLSANGSVSFSGNSNSDESGGAIYGRSNITLSANCSVSFSGNSADSGGAIYGESSSIITLNDNCSVSFSENTASYGGAIDGYDSTITLSGNESVTFSGNTARASGGAIYGRERSTITLSGNGSVTFSRNTASSSYDFAYGGAIDGWYDSTITLSGNGSVTFSGNTASSSSSYAYGGAIRTYGNLSIRNNDAVLFEKNAEIVNGFYRLRSIYAWGSGDVISLSAAEGKSIEFRDSIYIGSGSTVEFNADYTDSAGEVHVQKGDIIFTGAYTEAHLNELLADAGAGRMATAEEIRLSRTTEVYGGMTNLYGGCLRVEDGAIYQGRGITAMEGSNATVRVKDATLTHNGYDLTFHSGTTLELEGVNSITGNVQLLAGSMVRLKNATVSGNEIPLTFESERTLEMVGTNSINGDVQMLAGSTLRFVFDDAAGPGVALTLNDSLTLKEGSVLQRVGAEDLVILQGGGTLRMENLADFSAFSLGKDWSGTVALSDITVDTNLTMSTIGHAGSTIELKNVMGYTGVKDGKTVAANLVLMPSSDSDGKEQAAFCVSNGYSHKTNADFVMTTFSGAVSGEGKMVYEATLSNPYTGFAFTGDVSEWTGAFEMNGGKTFNLVFKENATEINAAIRDVSSSGTLNLILAADEEMRVNGEVKTDSIRVDNGCAVSFGSTVNTGSFVATGSDITFAAAGSITGDMTVAELVLQSGATLDVGGELSAGQISLQGLSTTTPVLTVGQFAAGDTVFELDIATLNALNLGHGESITIARADEAISGDFSAWLGEGSTSLDAAVYRYDMAVDGTDVQVSMDYSNWGTRVWYGQAWVGKEEWMEYMVAGYDTVDGVETVDLGGATLDGMTLLIAPGAAEATTVLSNGGMVVEMAEIVDGSLRIAADATLDVAELEAAGKDIHLAGELILIDGKIGTLSGTTGKLTIAAGGEVSIDSSVTLGTLMNNGSLDLGDHKLNVAAAVTTGGNVRAGEVVAHNRANKAAVFNTLIADKVTVTNALSSASYKDALSVAGGSVIGELVAETLEVRDGVVTLGRESGSTAMTLQGLNLQNDATLLLNQQTQLAVTDSMTATENALVQMKNGAGISYGEMSISNNGSSATTTVNAYELATGNLSKVENAHVAVESDADTTVDYQLVNATVENRGSGKLTVTHAQNSITAVRSEGGAIDILNVDTSDAGTVLKLATLELHGGATLGVYTGDTVDAAQEAWVQVSGSAVFGKGTTINADLELMEGCSLTLGGTVDMGSNLRINGTLTLDGELLAQIQAAEIGASFDLFTGIDNLYLSGVQYDSIALSDGMAASTYFVGLEDSLEAERGYRLTYASATPGEGVLSVHVVTIPEPTTATLSFLALAGLMLRRRRK